MTEETGIGEEDELEGSRAPLIEHLIELRKRLIYSVIGFVVVFGICLYFAMDIYEFLVRPLSDALHDQPGRRLIYTGLTEAMLVQIKVAFFAAIMLSFPLVAIQVWAFVAPGLYKNERRAFLPFLAATPVLFAVGAAMAYYVVFPLAWSFFLSFQTPGAEAGGLPIEFEGKVNEYLDLSMKLIFSFGVMFLMPVALTLLGHVGIINSAWLRDKRKYAIILIFVVASILTPPDIFSQCSLALPVCLLYEASIFMVRLAEKKRAAAAQI
ncbi:twin-arginine translocase subunit TatC [Emcibacter sp. SYSU 3D8]|uniref:twin-arginine translocase subunit TatC n=1 Tax=Emcibacter sp. SYSU 3D8 TaxID=3133969 RepID=UPI0031FF4208